MPELVGYSIVPTLKKGPILSSIEADYFIDDNIENVIEVYNDVPKCKVFLLVRPYNFYAIEFFSNNHKYKNINIVYSIEEFLDVLKKGEENV